ncbi:hypothetical protein BKA65DRAFT_475827 [Rhexocercosporidium sp. MPI-PUGE-AT-0058]|nr:hypothetical protein BKA65DRAFT_475827 [Rhexocercosporidium sp. MPI-PUGE-AT-0058]
MQLTHLALVAALLPLLNATPLPVEQVERSPMSEAVAEAESLYFRGYKINKEREAEAGPEAEAVAENLYFRGYKINKEREAEAEPVAEAHAEVENLYFRGYKINKE